MRLYFKEGDTIPFGFGVTNLYDPEARCIFGDDCVLIFKERVKSKYYFDLYPLREGSKPLLRFENCIICKEKYKEDTDNFKMVVYSHPEGSELNGTDEPYECFYDLLKVIESKCE